MWVQDRNLYPVCQKTPKNDSRLRIGNAVFCLKLLIYIGNKVVGGTGLEPAPIVLYLVINVYIVPNL